MAIYKKCVSANDIINGLVAVGAGARTATPQTHDDTSRTQHYASGDSLTTFLVLDTRYEVDPSGWNS